MAHNHEYALNKIRSPYFQMFIILLGSFMAILDTSVVQVAIPTMESALSASTDQIEWILTGYLLVIGVMVPITGWLTDRFGAKWLFVFALVTFTVGSALCGMSWNLSSIIVFRVIQAIGGGIMTPLSMAMIFMIFPPQRRGPVMALYGVVIMGAPAFGPLISGWLVQDASWRMIFYLNVPIGIVAIFFGLTRLYDFPHEAKHRLDVVGFVLSTTGFFLLLYGFSNVSQYGWTNWRVEPTIAAGTVLLMVLVWVELRHPHPLIQLRVLKNYMFTMSQLITSLIYVALYIGIFMMPLLLQNEMGYSALQTGAFMTPAGIASAVMMLISGRVVNRVGPRTLGIVGITIVLGATFGYTRLSVNSSAAYIQTLYIIRSIGMGIAMMPLMTAGMATLPVSLISQGSAVSNTIRQVAASLGTAILTNYMLRKETDHFVHYANKMIVFSPQGIQVSVLQQRLVQQGLSVAQAHSEALLLVYQTIQTKAFVAGLDDTFWISTLMAATALIATLFFSSASEQAARRGTTESAVERSNFVEI